MKKLILLLIVFCTYSGFVSCNPEVIEDTVKSSEDCCGNEGELPPPPPPPPPGEGN